MRPPRPRSSTGTSSSSPCSLAKRTQRRLSRRTTTRRPTLPSILSSSRLMCVNTFEGGGGVFLSPLARWFRCTLCGDRVLIVWGSITLVSILATSGGEAYIISSAALGGHGVAGLPSFTLYARSWCWIGRVFFTGSLSMGGTGVTASRKGLLFAHPILLRFKQRKEASKLRADSTRHGYDTLPSAWEDCTLGYILDWIP